MKAGSILLKKAYAILSADGGKLYSIGAEGTACTGWSGTKEGTVIPDLEEQPRVAGAKRRFRRFRRKIALTLEGVVPINSRLI